MLQVGLKGKKTVVVTTENTAERIASRLRNALADCVYGIHLFGNGPAVS